MTTSADSSATAEPGLLGPRITARLLGRLAARAGKALSLINISEPTRPERMSIGVFILKKKKNEYGGMWSYGYLCLIVLSYDY